MKLIQVTQAAKILGVSRQTIENWGKNGTLKIHKMGDRGNSHWVDVDAVTALSDTIKDIEHARQAMEKERKELQEEYRNEHRKLHDIRREVFMIDKFGTSSFIREFISAFPSILESIGFITSRESLVMRRIIAGDDIGWIAEDFGLTRSRIMQIFYKGCRKARRLKDIRDNLDELDRLRIENVGLKNTVRVMSNELKKKMVCYNLSDEERIRKIRETDEVIKTLSTSLRDCNLSVRALHCLRAAEIGTVGELVRYNKSDLLKFRNFGKRSLSELDDLLNSVGLSFGMDVDKVYRERIIQRMQEAEDKKTDCFTTNFV